MHLVWLTPIAALVGLAVVLPLAGWIAGELRVAYVRRALGLGPPRRRALGVPIALAAVFALVAVAAAQPVLASRGGRAAARAGQVFVVIDTSASMRAGEPTRYERATDVAEEARDSLQATRVGLASMTDRVLPHLFPSVDRGDFLATLHESMGIERPPPGRVREQASGFDALSAIGSARFFTNDGGPRVVLLLTDGESRSFGASSVAHALGRARVKVVVVRFWRAGERIAGDNVYRADPESGVDLRVLARALHAPLFDEHDAGDAVRAVDRDLGSRTAVTREQAAATAKPLASYAMLAALVPLVFVLWRRNIR